MGVGAIADDQIGAFDHAGRNITVQVERDHDPAIGTDRRPDRVQHRAVRIEIVGAHHGAMIADIDRIQRHGGLQPLRHALQRRSEKITVDRSARIAGSEDQRQRLPWPRCIHHADEGARFLGNRACRRAPCRQHLLAFEPVAAMEISFGRCRREAIALKDETKEGHTWSGHFSVPL